MQSFSYSTLSRWAKPVFGYLAIVMALAMLSAALVRTPSTAQAQDGKDSQQAGPESTTATFPADAPSLGPIPDSDLTSPVCQNNSTTFRDVTFTVTGLSGNAATVAVSFSASHTFLQDLEVSLRGPGGAPSHLLFAATGTTATAANSCAGSASDLSTANTYTFADTAAANWWTTAVTTPVPTSSNRSVVTGIGGTTNPPATTTINTTFASTAANGTWTLRFRDRGAGDTGTVTAASLTITASAANCTTAKRPLDFNGDGTTDFSIVRNTGGGPTGQVTWFNQLNNGAGTNSATPWGIATDFFVPGDYDGDGKSDFAVWRPGPPTQAFWYILQSGTNTLRSVSFGQTGDDPTVQGDYDGDGKVDPAVYRSGAAAGDHSFWYYQSSVTGLQTFGAEFGQNGDFPAPGDYDGDGKFDYVVQRNDGGGQARFYRKFSSAIPSDTVVFGTPTDVIVPGYYDADCKTDIATLRGSGGAIQWNVRNSTDGSYSFQQFGLSATDFPVQGDYDGDGKTDFAIWRPNADPNLNFFYFLKSGTNTLGSRNLDKTAIIRWQTSTRTKLRIEVDYLV